MWCHWGPMQPSAPLLWRVSPKNSCRRKEQWNAPHVLPSCRQVNPSRARSLASGRSRWYTHCSFPVSAVVSLLLPFKSAFLGRPRAWLKCLLLQLLWLNQSSCVIQGQPGLGLFIHPFCSQFLRMRLLTKALTIAFIWTICTYHIVKRTPPNCDSNCLVQKYLS